MNLYLLGGNSKHNKDWIEEVDRGLSDLFDHTKVLYYDHWQLEEDQTIDLDLELNKLVEIIGSDSDYAIFAKSFGAILTLKGIVKGVLKPHFCFFAGTAILAGRKNWPQTDEWLKGLNVPTLFIQKSQDPAINADDLKKLLEEYKVPNYNFAEIPGDNHNYDDISNLHDLIQNYVRQ